MEQKTSIIIPVYNAGEFIIRCLDSIRLQTYKQVETILLHDFGTDNSVEIIKKYKSEHPDFPCLLIENEENLGLSLTRNKGMEVATGDFILFMDQDDELTSKDSLQLLLEKIQATDADFVIGGTRFLQNNTPKESRYHTLKNKKEVYDQEEILDGFFSGEWAATAWNKLYKKDFLQKNNLQFIPKLLHEDELWAFETAVAAHKIAFLDRPTYTYYSLSNPTSMTGNGTMQNVLDVNIILLKMVDISLEKDLLAKTPKTFAYLQGFAQYTVLNRPILLADKRNWKTVYMKIQKKFSEIPGQKLFKKPAELAYIAYRTKFDKDFSLYGKLLMVFNRLL